MPETAPLGEFERIGRFFRPLAAPGALALTDDAALLAPAPGHVLVVTADALVEGLNSGAMDTQHPLSDEHCNGYWFGEAGLASIA